MLDDRSAVCEVIDCRLVLDAVDKVLQRREYFREKQRSHRRRERDDFCRLRKQAEELEAQVERMRRTHSAASAMPPSPVSSDVDVCSLPWHVVAATFRQETRLALAKNSDLAKATRSYRSLLSQMQMWVAQNDMVPVIPQTIVRWQQVTLSDDPTTRKMTKEWATQQMYHNTGAAFREFPTSMGGAHDDFSIFDLTIDGMCVNIVEYSQFVWEAPMEAVSHMLRHHMHDLSKLDASSVTEEWTENTVLLQTTLPDGDAASVILGQFHEAERCVVVMRQVQTDQILRDEDGAPLRDSQALLWFDLRRLGDGRTLARSTNLASIHLKPSGEGSMEGIAATMGLDLTDIADDDRPHVLRQFYLNKAYKSDLEMRSHIVQVLQRVRTKLAATVVPP